MKTTVTFNIAEFLQNHPKSTEYVAAWFKLVETGQWTSFDRMRRAFPSLKGEEKAATFAIACGRYRIQARINFKYKQIIIRNIVEDADYDARKTEENAEALP